VVPGPLTVARDPVQVAPYGSVKLPAVVLAVGSRIGRVQAALDPLGEVDPVRR
jgi:hypothetical protein